MNLNSLFIGATRFLAEHAFSRSVGVFPLARNNILKAILWALNTYLADNEHSDFEQPSYRVLLSVRPHN